MMLQTFSNVLDANKARWMGETEIVRAAHPGKRDSEITDAQWGDVLRSLSEIKARGFARSRRIGPNDYVWRAK